LKFQAIAEKTAKNRRGLLFSRILYIGAREIDRSAVHMCERKISTFLFHLVSSRFCIYLSQLHCHQTTTTASSTACVLYRGEGGFKTRERKIERERGESV